LILKYPVTKRISIPCRPGGLFPSLMAAVCLLFCAGKAHGQEALQMSLAGDMAAEIQHQQENTIGYYNLLWGPVAWRFSSGLGINYDDNVRLQSQNPEGDFIFRPNLQTQMHWPVTPKNSLDISMDAGYSLYATHSELNQLYVNPGSGLSFNIYAGDCVINLHDRVLITENAYQNAAAGGGGNSERLENTAGTSAFWDLNKLVAKLGYDHANYISLGSGQQVPDATSENWFLNAGVHPLPEITVGLEGGLGLISYDQSQSASSQPDATQWNAGAFFKAQISEYIYAQVDAGYTVYSPANNMSGFTNLSSSANMYFQIMVAHQVNQSIGYALYAGRSTESSFTGQPTDYYFARLEPKWNIFKNYQLSTPLFWEKGTQLANRLYGQGGTADYTQYGAGFNVDHHITQKLTGSLGYQFVRESGGQSSLNYTVNIVSLSFSYQF
jgi:hypothetical protein